MKKNREINDRIEQIVNERFEGNRASFARALKLSNTALGNYLGPSRRSIPNVNIVADIVRILDVDAKWLLTGVHSSLKSKSLYPGSDSETSALSLEDTLLNLRVKHLEALLAEKDARINDLREMIDQLKNTASQKKISQGNIEVPE